VSIKTFTKSRIVSQLPASNDICTVVQTATRFSPENLTQLGQRQLNLYGDSPPSHTIFFSLAISISAHGLQKPLMLHEPNRTTQ
jgi:hypothetical protein